MYISCKNQLRGNDFQKIEKSIKVFLNERDLSSCWIIQRAYRAEASGPGHTRGALWLYEKINPYAQWYSQAAFTFHSGTECIYLQFHHTVAPSKLKSNINAAVSFCCFWKISSKEAVCLDWVYQEFTFNQMALNNLERAFLLYCDEEKIITLGKWLFFFAS